MPEFVNFIIAVILGMVVGSFLNVVILRFDDLKSIVNTRSHCPSCKRELTWYELVPFFSYIALQGKCRTCKKGISIQYPIVEVGTGLLFGLILWKFGLTWVLVPYLLITCILIVVFVYDILYYLVADFLVWLAIGIWVAYLIIQFIISNFDFSLLLHSLYGGLALGGFLALLVVVSREKWMGAGDIKLGFLLGAIASWPGVLLGSFAAFSLGSILGIILILVHQKKMKDKIPFAPFLITGMFIALFFGDKIINWYLTSLGF